MILLYNVKITDKRNPTIRLRKYEWTKYDNRLDIFMFSLDAISQAKSLFDKIIINVILEDNYSDKNKILENYIYNLFYDSNIYLNFSRYNFRNDWTHFFETYNIQDKDIIFFMGNDDHIFIDHDLNFLSKIKNIFSNDDELMNIFGYSHFPESIRSCATRKMNLVDNNFICIDDVCDINFSMHIFKAYRLKKALFEVNYPKDFPVFRLDELVGFVQKQKYSDFTAKCYSPLKEMVRHYDGYGHEMYSNNYNPPLEIPTGFFEKDIKIKYGFKTRFENYMNVNPSAPLLYACNKIGHDNRYFIDENNNLDDIPLVYKNKISFIDHKENLNYDYLKEKRNYFYLKSTKQKINYLNNNFCVLDEWIKLNYI